MRLLQFSVLLLLVMGEEVPDCMISCCLACTPGNNCQVCYQLNRWNPLTCPCVGSLQGGDVSLLGTFQRLANSGSIQFSETLVEEDTVELRVSRQREEPCQPLCCPTVTCTKDTCPNCFNRNTLNPKSCPCIEIK